MKYADRLINKLKDIQNDVTEILKGVETYPNDFDNLWGAETNLERIIRDVEEAKELALRAQDECEVDE